MATYLLLRDNKNSGPYSLEALIQLGLKPYDLVWVEGKSAAWRYPSEVEDLKFYAPVVEEQPYDRFYKKPSEKKTVKENKQEVTQEAKPVQNLPEVNYSIAAEVKQNTKIADVKTPKKQVYVSLPANTGNSLVKKPASVTASVNELAGADYYNGHSGSVKITDESKAPTYPDLVNDYNSYQPNNKKIATSDNSELPYSGKQAIAETKYAQSLDDIKDIYVQTLVDRKRKTAQKKRIMKAVKRGIPFAAVLITGFIMGGLLMNRKNGDGKTSQLVLTNAAKPVTSQDNKKEPANQAVVPVTQTTATLQQPVENPTQSTNAPETLAKSTEPKKELKLDKNASPQLPLNVVKKFVAKQNETTKGENDHAGGTLSKTQNIEADPATGERNKIVRSATENNGAEKENNTASSAKGNLLRQVNVKGNDYKVGTFGGIHDLQLTVVNNSNFLLDRVMVELQYLKPSQQPLKTSNVQFDNVPPNGSLTLAIPATNRGIKVTYKVINVQSRAAGNDTAGL